MIRLITLIENLIAALQDQSYYDDVTVGPAFDEALDPPLAGFEVLTTGDVEIVTPAGNTRVISASTGRIYPLGIQQIVSTNTTVAQADIIGYIE